ARPCGGDRSTVRGAQQAERSTPMAVSTSSSFARIAATRRGLLAGSALAATGLLARCGSPEAAQPSTTSSAPAEIWLSVWADVQDWDVYRAMIDDFQKAHPNAKVQGEQYKGTASALGGN